MPKALFLNRIKVSANVNKKIKQEIPAAAKRYRDELLAEIKTDREVHGKKPFDVTVCQNETGQHQRQSAHEAHTACKHLQTRKGGHE